MGQRLSGKVAIITGGSRGIGAAIAMAMAESGARVVVASRKEAGVLAAAEAINQVHPGAAFARVCHTGDPEQIKALVAWTEAEVGVADILVNNAATNPHFGPLLTVDYPAWDKTFEVNVKGYFEPTRQVVNRLVELKRPGSIINISSVAGLRGIPLQGVYSMTKAAVISMTRTLAVELGGAGIRVNAIAPGLVETRLAQAVTADPEMSAFFNERSALKRHAQPTEIAGMAVFLASNEASFVTGQTLRIDGGWSAA
jgi:NAD(P)-dependent dehydrogenase (short-subunit alcohol dehydrogenase family)